MAITALNSITKLYYSTGSAASGSEVIGITDLTFPTVSRPTVDVSNMDSLAREFKPAFLTTPGVLSFTFQWVPTNAVHKALYARANTAGGTGSISTDMFRLTTVDGSNYDFTGSVTEVGIKASNPAEGMLMADAKVQASGLIVSP